MVTFIGYYTLPPVLYLLKRCDSSAADLCYASLISRLHPPDMKPIEHTWYLMFSLMEQHSLRILSCLNPQSILC